jgi:hypothetical protein
MLTSLADICFSYVEEFVMYMSSWLVTMLFKIRFSIALCLFIFSILVI